MKAQEISQVCQSRSITFIPHHQCQICGEYVGWYLFYRWPPYEVAFSSACGCCKWSTARESNWEEIAKWICDKDGNVREGYKYLEDTAKGIQREKHLSKFETELAEIVHSYGTPDESPYNVPEELKADAARLLSIAPRRLTWEDVGCILGLAGQFDYIMDRQARLQKVAEVFNAEEETEI